MILKNLGEHRCCRGIAGYESVETVNQANRGVKVESFVVVGGGLDGTLVKFIDYLIKFHSCRYGFTLGVD